jgi:Domain of unknown function (DUF4252)
MMKNVILILVIIITGGIFTSCNNDPSLQEYYVEKHESNNFIALDLPASIINLKEDVSPETKETISSFKKLNILAFKLNNSNSEEYKVESNRVKNILKNKKYSELVRVKHQNANIVLKYQGKDDAIDEFIFFASDDSKGFAIARILGNNMNPEKIMKLAQNLDEFNADSTVFNQIGGLLDDFDIE